jgi:hypothetical protein
MYELIEGARVGLAAVLSLAPELVQFAAKMTAIDGAGAWFGRPQPVSIARGPEPLA